MFTKLDHDYLLFIKFSIIAPTLNLLTLTDTIIFIFIEFVEKNQRLLNVHFILSIILSIVYTLLLICNSLLYYYQNTQTTEMVLCLVILCLLLTDIFLAQYKNNTVIILSAPVAIFGRYALMWFTGSKLLNLKVDHNIGIFAF